MAGTHSNQRDTGGNRQHQSIAFMATWAFCWVSLACSPTFSGAHLRTPQPFRTPSRPPSRPPPCNPHRSPSHPHSLNPLFHPLFNPHDYQFPSRNASHQAKLKARYASCSPQGCPSYLCTTKPTKHALAAAGAAASVAAAELLPPLLLLLLLSCNLLLADMFPSAVNLVASPLCAHPADASLVLQRPVAARLCMRRGANTRMVNVEDRTTAELRRALAACVRYKGRETHLRAICGLHGQLVSPAPVGREVPTYFRESTTFVVVLRTLASPVARSSL